MTPVLPILMLMRNRRARRQPLVAGFVLQTLTGALTDLLPVAFGNRKLCGTLDPGLAAGRGRDNPGGTQLAAWPAGEWLSAMGWWLASLGLGSFVPLAAAALLASHLRTEEAT